MRAAPGRGSQTAASAGKKKGLSYEKADMYMYICTDPLYPRCLQYHRGIAGKYGR